MWPGVRTNYLTSTICLRGKKSYLYFRKLVRITHLSSVWLLMLVTFHACFVYRRLCKNLPPWEVKNKMKRDFLRPLKMNLKLYILSTELDQSKRSFSDDYFADILLIVLDPIFVYKFSFCFADNISIILWLSICIETEHCFESSWEEYI